MDDIIRMARDAGFTIEGPFIFSDDPDNNIKKELARFAALVAAAEREACISIIEGYRIPVGNSAAGEMACEWTYDALREIRAAIRARAQQPPATVEDRLARHGIPMPDQPLPDDHDGNPSF